MNDARDAERIVRDSIIYLRQRYVDAYERSGKNQYGIRTPAEMNFPPWAWSNPY